MAITTNAICDSFKKQLLGGEHDFDSSGGDTYKLAMYTSSATLGKSTANYITANEVSNTGTYAAGGGTLVNQGVKVSSSVAITDFADLSVTGVTLTARVLKPSLLVLVILIQHTTLSLMKMVRSK